MKGAESWNQGQCACCVGAGGISGASQRKDLHQRIRGRSHHECTATPKSTETVATTSKKISPQIAPQHLRFDDSAPREHEAMRKENGIASTPKVPTIRVARAHPEHQSRETCGEHNGPKAFCQMTSCDMSQKWCRAPPKMPNAAKAQSARPHLLLQPCPTNSAASAPAVNSSTKG